MYRDNPNSEAMNKMRQEIASKNALLRGKDQDIEKLQTEVRSIKYNKNSPNLRQAINETQKQVNLEKHRADTLALEMQKKEGQLRTYANSLGQKDLEIQGLRSQLRSQPSNSGEVLRLKGQLQGKEDELARLKREKANLESNWGNLKRANEDMQRKQENALREQLGERDRAVEQMMRDKDQSTQQMLKMKDQQIGQMQDNLQFFKRQAADFKKEAQNEKDSKNQKVEDLEKLLEEQNDQMKLMRRDIMQMEKVIEDKDNAIKKMAEIQYQGKGRRPALIR